VVPPPIQGEGGATRCARGEKGSVFFYNRSLWSRLVKKGMAGPASEEELEPAVVPPHTGEGGAARCARGEKGSVFFYNRSLWSRLVKNGRGSLKKDGRSSLGGRAGAGRGAPPYKGREGQLDAHDCPCAEVGEKARIWVVQNTDQSLCHRAFSVTPPGTWWFRRDSRAAILDCLSLLILLPA
jgi:hypothetical protein